MNLSEFLAGVVLEVLKQGPLRKMELRREVNRLARYTYSLGVIEVAVNDLVLAGLVVEKRKGNDWLYRLKEEA